jgi:hypothetical protein
MTREARSMVRFLMTTAAGAAMLLAASAAGAGEGGAAKRDSAADRALAPAIVQLETRAGRVTVYGGELGRYYTIVSKDGRVVAERISADELAANHPDVAATVDRGVAVQMADLPQ